MTSGFDLPQKRRQITAESRRRAHQARPKVKLTPQKVRPIQMVEFLRQYVSRRLPALGEGEIATLTAAMRQLGVCSKGGAEALAIFHQLIFDRWVRNAGHPASLALSVQPMPTDRGAEQGGVDGPLARSPALGMVAAEARLCAAVQQAARTLTCIDTRDLLHERRLQAEQRNRMLRIQNFLSHLSRRSATCSARKRRPGGPVASG